MSPVDVLNRLVVIHHRSLSHYLSYASPTWHRGNERAQEVLQSIAADQQDLVERLGEMIMDRDAVVRFGSFPMRFTAFHDLSFDYLLDQLLEHQHRDLASIGECVAELQADPMALALAQEARGMAKAHLELLEELKRAARPVEPEPSS
jgi:hypothetical protein